MFNILNTYFHMTLLYKHKTFSDRGDSITYIKIMVDTRLCDISAKY